MVSLNLGFQIAASLWAPLPIGDVEYVREGTRLADLAILGPPSVIPVNEIKDEDPAMQDDVLGSGDLSWLYLEIEGKPAAQQL